MLFLQQAALHVKFVWTAVCLGKLSGKLLCLMTSKCLVFIPSPFVMNVPTVTNCSKGPLICHVMLSENIGHLPNFSAATSVHMKPVIKAI